jgi:hypothetical protein
MSVKLAGAVEGPATHSPLGERVPAAQAAPTPRPKTPLELMRSLSDIRWAVHDRIVFWEEEMFYYRKVAADAPAGSIRRRMAMGKMEMCDKARSLYLTASDHLERADRLLGIMDDERLQS